MNFVFLVQVAIVLVFTKRTTNALASKQNFTDGAAISTYLKNQSKMAQNSSSLLSPNQIQVGNRTIKTMSGSPSPRGFDTDHALIFHKNGTITTYNVDGVGAGQALLTMRAGKFEIDEEIFGLVFPGFSMDKGPKGL